MESLSEETEFFLLELYFGHDFVFASESRTVLVLVHAQDSHNSGFCVQEFDRYLQVGTKN